MGRTLNCEAIQFPRKSRAAFGTNSGLILHVIPTESFRHTTLISKEKRKYLIHFLHLQNLNTVNYLDSSTYLHLQLLLQKQLQLSHLSRDDSPWLNDPDHTWAEIICRLPAKLAEWSTSVFRQEAILFLSSYSGWFNACLHTLQGIRYDQSVESKTRGNVPCLKEGFSFVCVFICYTLNFSYSKWQENITPILEWIYLEN